VPAGDATVDVKERKQVDKYQDLATEQQSLLASGDPDSGRSLEALETEPKGLQKSFYKLEQQ